MSVGTAEARAVAERLRQVYLEIPDKQVKLNAAIDRAIQSLGSSPAVRLVVEAMNSAGRALNKLLDKLKAAVAYVLDTVAGYYRLVDCYHEWIEVKGDATRIGVKVDDPRSRLGERGWGGDAANAYFDRAVPPQVNAAKQLASSAENTGMVLLTMAAAAEELFGKILFACAIVVGGMIPVIVTGPNPASLAALLATVLAAVGRTIDGVVTFNSWQGKAVFGLSAELASLQRMGPDGWPKATIPSPA